MAEIGTKNSEISSLPTAKNLYQEQNHHSQIILYQAQNTCFNLI